MPTAVILSAAKDRRPRKSARFFAALRMTEPDFPHIAT